VKSDLEPYLLVVDDDAASCLLARTALQRIGYTVATAGSGEEARRRLAESAPILILMDIQLPDVNGLDLTAQLKANPLTAAIPIVVLTAHSMPIFERAAYAAGCDGYLMKPSSPADLAHGVRDFLHRVAEN
jgi:two-component system cell cycle response regulator DivK